MNLNLLKEDYYKYNNLNDQCKTWEKKYNDLIDIIKYVNLEINKEIDEFNQICSGFKNCENQIYKSRIKGIRLIGKMYDKTVMMNLNKLKLKKQEENLVTDFDEKEICNLKTFNNTKNNNFNVISSKKKFLNNTIKNYIKFITFYILPILDGVYSGIQYLNKEENKDDNNLNTILNYYHKLSESINKILEKCDIKKINVEKLETFKCYYHEPFDVEITKDASLDEKIMEVIRNGYKYKGSLFDEEEYIIRPTQVIVYKFEKGGEQKNV